MSKLNFVTPVLQDEALSQRRTVSDKLARHIAQTDRHRRQADAQAARQLSRKALYTATATLCNEALRMLHELINERIDGHFVNFDQRTWRILVPMPTGWRHCGLYGLRRAEADVLRFIMLERSRQKDPAPLYVFDNGKWYLNAADYRGTKAAAQYLVDYPITAEIVVMAMRKMGAR